MDERNKTEIPIWKKTTLNIVEATAYSGVGQTKLRKLARREDCPFALWVGHKCLIKRRALEEYLGKMYSI